MLGNIYSYGQGVEKNPDKDCECFEKAAGRKLKEEYKHINILSNNIYSNRNIWYDVEDVKG